jgi:hypothetical protein
MGHFIGLALGIGAATVLDLMLIRYFLTQKITTEKWHVFLTVTYLVNAGLTLLWITGISFLILYSYTDPHLLHNQKIMAKVIIVSCLTLNGFYIHFRVLPYLADQIFEGMTNFQKTSFLTSGAVSATSWYVPLMLGTMVQLNFTVPAWIILGGWASLVVLFSIVINLVIRRFP